MGRNLLLATLLWTQLGYAGAMVVAQGDVEQASPGAASDARFCRNGLFPREQADLTLGVIKAINGQKVHFYRDDEGCPSLQSQCARREYLVSGDQVLVGKHTGSWACVWYFGKKHEFVAWVPKRNVNAVQAPPFPAIDDWIGDWVYHANRIHLYMDDSSGRPAVRSELRWDGGTTSTGDTIAHYGGMRGTLDVAGARATAVEGSCKLTLARIGEFLVADDNGNCGGANVRHGGVFRRSVNGR